MVSREEMDSLARYFFWADVMRDLFEKSFEREQTFAPDGGVDAVTFALMSYWFGALYVVIEGWETLGISDQGIDGLLADDDKKKHLKLYRNATFHFQKEMYHNKFLRFMSPADESTKWVQSVHLAFKQYFDGWGKEQYSAPDEK